VAFCLIDNVGKQAFTNPAYLFNSLSLLPIAIYHKTVVVVSNPLSSFLAN
jgi:hypothetical protein